MPRRHIFLCAAMVLAACVDAASGGPLVRAASAGELQPELGNSHLAAELGELGRERLLHDLGRAHAHAHTQPGTRADGNAFLQRQECPDWKFQCPCCGHCDAPLSTRNKTALGSSWRECTACASRDRHRKACLSIRGLTPPHKQCHGATDRDVVAYFGPHQHHAEQVEACGAHLLRFDYFHPGIESITSTYHRSTVRADVQDIPLQRGSIDGAIVLHVLEHVQSHKAAAGELARVIRPGGYLLVETPCDGGIERHLNCDEVRGKDSSGFGSTSRSLCSQVDHRWALSCGMLASELAEAGFACTGEAELLTKTMTERYGLEMGRGWFKSCLRLH